MPLVWKWLRKHGDGAPCPGGSPFEMPSDKGPYRPALPEEFFRRGGRFVQDDSFIDDLVAADGTQVNQFVHLGFEEEHLPLIPEGSVVPEDAVPERDRLATRMLRACRGGWDARADAFFDGIPGALSAAPARRRLIKDVLLQAVARGLSPAGAEAIRARLDLPAGGKEADHGR